MNKLVKKILLGLTVLAIAIYFGYQYIINIGARDFESEKSAFVVEAKSIGNEFTNNTDASNKKYLNKAIEVTGIITDNQKNTVTLDQVVSCQIKATTPPTKGQKITLKGRVTGYDDLIGEIKMDQCLIIKSK